LKKVAAAEPVKKPKLSGCGKGILVPLKPRVTKKSGKID